MIRRCTSKDITSMYQIINDAATAYDGHIPPDRYHTPYMPVDELRMEIDDGVEFFGIDEDGELVAIMGIQDRGEVALIRHAYTKSACQGRGFGSKLITYLLDLTEKPVLVGTWKAATWAVAFYEKHGFRLTTDEEKDRLLKRYWKIPARQIDTSVVLIESDGLG